MALLVAVPLALLLAGTAIILTLDRQIDTGRSPLPAATTSSPSPSVRPTTSPSTAQPGESPDAVAMLKACRDKIRAADKVLAVAKDGMSHWSDHVQAQTDANAGKITLAEMGRIFHATRQSGAADERRYNEAVEQRKEEKGSCPQNAGVPHDIAQQIDACASRGHAQEAVLNAADEGMSDWISHLGDMRRADQGQIHNAQATWLQTWRAAPTNIKAYNEALAHFQDPPC